MSLDNIKKTAAYEIGSNIEALKDLNTWMVIVGILTFLFVLYKKYLFGIFGFIILFILQAKYHYNVGEVTDWWRKKHHIPNSRDIKRMKNNNQN